MNNINWEHIDWKNLRNAEIATTLNISASNISAKRRKFAPETIGKFTGSSGVMISEKITDPDLLLFIERT